MLPNLSCGGTSKTGCFALIIVDFLDLDFKLALALDTTWGIKSSFLLHDFFRFLGYLLGTSPVLIQAIPYISLTSIIYPSEGDDKDNDNEGSFSPARARFDINIIFGQKLSSATTLAIISHATSEIHVTSSDRARQRREQPKSFCNQRHSTDAHFTLSINESDTTASEGRMTTTNLFSSFLQCTRLWGHSIGLRINRTIAPHRLAHHHFRGFSPSFIFAVGFLLPFLSSNLIDFSSWCSFLLSSLPPLFLFPFIRFPPNNIQLPLYVPSPLSLLLLFTQ